jgi:hypothetical protein
LNQKYAFVAVAASIALGGSALAGVCGTGGSCAVAHPEPGCDDAACCTTICAVLLSCCETGWDQTCVDFAISECGIFIYECVPTAIPNDCVADATSVAVPSATAFNSTNANTDGPPQAECNSAKGDTPIWKDLWFYWTSTADGVLTASTCDTTAFDTKIAIYNLGTDLPSEIDPDLLPALFVSCNEDCDTSPDFASELSVAVSPGNVYLVRVGGYLQAGGPGVLELSLVSFPPPYTCDDGGPVIFTQSNDPIAAEGQVACAAGAITTANQFARSFVNGTEEYFLDCVDFGFSNSGEALVGSLNVYIDSDGGEPIGPGIDLVLLGDRPVTLPNTEGGGGGSNCCVANGGLGCDDPTCEAAVCGADAFCCDTEWDALCAASAATLCPDLCGTTPPPVANLIVSFDTPLAISAGQTFVVEIDIPASASGFAVCAGNTAGETAPTYIRSTPCGIDDFATYASIGQPNANWALTVLGKNPAAECPYDFNDDGEVNGADLGSLLAAWDNPYTGADLGALLAAWGPCAK